MDHCNYTLKRKRGRPCRNKVKGDSTSFFKIFLQPTLEEKKMRLPNRFVEKNGGNLVSPAVNLVDPGGRSWPVRVSRDGGDVWFDGGRWIDLVNFYSIQYGHFMVFEYDGKSRFDFKIFDMSTCDIDYKSCETKATASRSYINLDEEDEEEDEEDDEDENEDDHKSDYMARVEDHDDPLNFLHEGRLVIPMTPTGEIESYVSRRFGMDPPYGFCDEERRRVVQALKTTNPLHPNFFVLIKKIGGSQGLYMPAGFTKKYFSDELSDRTSTIVDGHGGNWSVTMTPRIGARGFIMHAANFIRGTNLKVGDICIFELIKIGGSVFKASTFRAPPNPNV